MVYKMVERLDIVVAEPGMLVESQPAAVDKLAAVRYISRKDTKTVSSVVSSILKRKK